MKQPSDDRAAQAADRAEAERLLAAAGLDVSHETWDRLGRFINLLQRWQPAINLIGPSTLPKVWTRHVADSLQLLPLVPDARRFVDLGSGGGFPGLAIACALAGRPGAAVHLVESDRRKAAFLREAARAAGAPATVHAERIEKFTAQWRGEAEVVTARGLAPLTKLLAYAAPLLEKGAQALFLKGRDVEAELTESYKYWHMEIELRASVTDRAARIVWVRRAARKTANAAC